MTAVPGEVAASMIAIALGALVLAVMWTPGITLRQQCAIWLMHGRNRAGEAWWYCRCVLARRNRLRDPVPGLPVDGMPLLGSEQVELDALAEMLSKPGIYADDPHRGQS